MTKMYLILRDKLGKAPESQDYLEGVVVQTLEGIEGEIGTEDERTIVEFDTDKMFDVETKITVVVTPRKAGKKK